MIGINVLDGDAQKRFFECLEKNVSFKKVEILLVKSLGRFSIHLLKGYKIPAKKILSQKLCKLVKAEPTMTEECIRLLETALVKAGKAKKIELFKCPLKTHGFCFSLRYGEEVLGYLIGCGVKNEIPLSLLHLFEHFVGTTISDIRKQMQLEDLYKTIKPRAIALSTVHTVHRLISSTLYLDELLSRIARLSMQIIKANRCSIKLVDSKKKTLLPKATVDLRMEKIKLKKVKIGMWAPGKAVKYGKSIKGARYLATPLIDEDAIGVITLYDKINGEAFNEFDVEIMRTLAEQAAVAIKNAQLFKEQEKLTMGSIKALAQIIESRGTGICIPKSSFLKIVQLIGHEFKMRESELKTLQYATLLHDTGELMIPENVIRKKGKLTEKEYMLIKEHPLKGAKIIKSLKSLKSIAPLILHHHENYNGTGYPKGLKGAEIPLGARIMGVVGAFEAMITRRPYRVPVSMAKALEEIRKNSGKQFDPKVVTAFLKIVTRKDVFKLLKKEIYRHKS